MLPLSYITDVASLSAFCDRAREYPSLALDTEFSTRTNYFPRLRLVQMAAGPEEVGVIDCYRVPALGPVLELLFDHNIEKVVHAGRQDVGIFVRMVGKVPAPLFDTMVAASLVGYGPQPAYQVLVERITGQRLAKGHTRSDWDRPQLTSDQLHYAQEDVAWLPAVAAHLKQELAALGRTAWAQEEFARLAEPSHYLPPDPAQQYLRVRERYSLAGVALGVLRELAAWREQAAQTADLPRPRIIPDDALVQLARRAGGGKELAEADCPQSCRQYLPELPQAVARAWQSAGEATAACPPAEENGFVELLQAFVRSRCLEQRVAPTVVANREELQALCAAAGNGHEPPALPVLGGWRRSFIGEDLLALLRGELSLTVDRACGHIRAQRTQARRQPRA